MTRAEFDKAMADLPPTDLEPDPNDCEVCFGVGRLVITSADANQLGVAWVFAWAAAGGEGSVEKSIKCLCCSGTGKKGSHVR